MKINKVKVIQNKSMRIINYSIIVQIVSNVPKIDELRNVDEKRMNIKKNETF